ncbi:MAG TPA: aspartate dehydrogenase [Methanomicrobiales archaeon]|jgi:aspartate dehydrogenase|nr:aspartate dehydrogenase [Methanomicrobiales archaeon]
MIRVGLLGCGNVGRIIAKDRTGVEIAAIHDRIPERAEEAAKLCDAKVHRAFSTFVRADFDIVVEAASVAAVRDHAEEILSNGKDLVILSVGALADRAFLGRITALAREKGRRIHVPSGAIFGLDNLKVGQITPLRRLLLRTTKSPESLNIRAEKRMMIFSGKANDCIRQFPKNINVAVALGLAAGREADVEIWIDPAVDRNIHEIIAEGDFGEVFIQVSNVPSPDNPATSYLAALSILTLLKNLDEPLVVGT